MKKMITLLLIMSSIIAYPQCEGDIISAGISTNLKGITFEVSRIAQETKLGFILGSTLSLGKEKMYDYVYDNKTHTNIYQETSEEYAIYASIHGYITYKLIHKEYQYSLHMLIGGVWDERKGPYLSGGFELRKPINTKCIFIRGLYPGDFRCGVLFQL